jgi:tellurite resistance protein TerA
MDRPKKNSIESLASASRSVVDFSGHGNSLGAAGYRVSSDHPENCEFLSEPGQSISITPGSNGFEEIVIGLAWDPIVENSKKTLVGKLLKKKAKIGVDLDIGCFYELKDGTRGVLQAFGNKYGNLHDRPFISLSGDERTGETEGHDEFLLINGQKWDEIKRVLVYIYIYQGAQSWSEVKPQVVIDVPGENDLYVTLNAYDDALCLCAVGELESVRGGIRLTNRTEYFPGHEEMDRAFGFGLNWADGQKDPL